MKKHLFTILVVLFAVALPASAAEEPSTDTTRLEGGGIEIPVAPALPSRVSGRWYTPDRMYSNTMALENIDVSKRVAKLVYNSTRFGCSIDGSSVTITKWDGHLFEASLDRGTDCFKEIKFILMYDGLALEGEMHFVTLIPGGVPMLVTRLSP